MQLQILLKSLVKVSSGGATEISGLALDSRKVKPGDLFLAYRGAAVDGRDYIPEALAQGAVAILSEAEVAQGLVPTQIPCVIFPELPANIGSLAAKFYDYPSKHLTVIGVTGTNGKTSTTHFIASSLTALGIKCGFIGTIGVGFPSELTPVLNTTPDPITLQFWLAEFKKQGAQAVAMEVSSHSLVQGRVGGIDFKIAVLTNLTRDHLDYHGSMEKYAAAKKLLFLWPKLQYAVINADDNFGRQLLQELPATLHCYAYTLRDEPLTTPTVRASHLQLDMAGMSAEVVTPWGTGEMISRCLGRFNVSNLLATLTVLGILQIKLPSALQQVKNLAMVNGRMQMFSGEKKPLVVVDYSHTPDALEQALSALHEYCTGALWCVFGCGGDRDRGKRPLMGQIAERLSDHLIITNDNPRTEDPQKIIDEILAGLLCPWAAEVEQDRQVAIAHAIECAQPNDIILVAGKGHEDYQIIGKEKLHFSDQEIIIKILHDL